MIKKFRFGNIIYALVAGTLFVKPFGADDFVPCDCSDNLLNSLDNLSIGDVISFEGVKLVRFE